MVDSGWINLGHLTTGEVSFHFAEPGFRETSFPAYTRPVDDMHIEFSLTQAHMGELGPLLFGGMWASMLTDLAAIEAWENEGGVIQW